MQCYYLILVGTRQSISALTSTLKAIIELIQATHRLLKIYIKRAQNDLSYTAILGDK